jgi:non-specific serine/threonine protein kinase
MNDGLAKHVVMLLDSFEHKGPNGVHQCLVFEPMGASVGAMVEDLPCNKPFMIGVQPKYPKPMAKKILKHALSGLAFLHKNDVVHGDVQPGNMLFAVPKLDALGEEQLKQHPQQISESIRRLDGKEDIWAPKYLASGQPLDNHVDLEQNMTIKLSDLGSGMSITLFGYNL